MARFHRSFFTILAFSFHLQVCVSECSPSVLALRGDLYVPEGGMVSLSCDVQHCEQKGWTGGWGITEDGHFTLLTPSSLVHLSNLTISGNITRLLVVIHNVNQSDSGVYQCKIYWQNTISQGHVTHINVTAVLVGASRSTERKLSHRLLICGAASLLLTLLFILTRFFGLEDQSAPPVPPHPRTSCTSRVKPKAEVTYAALIMKSPRQQSKAQETVPTVYSTVNFSKV